MITNYAAALRPDEQRHGEEAARRVHDHRSAGAEAAAGVPPQIPGVLPEVKVVRYYQIENKIYAALVYEIGAKIPLVKAAK